MTTWREQLQPASFRGVRFEVDSDSSPVGRRTQTHEFVQRDQPFVEDLGRQTREFKFTAFVIGADCYDKRDALLAALDKPGPGELVHPQFGKLNVTAGDCSVSHERREGGLVRFDLVFIEAGEKGFPVGTPNTGRQLVKAKGGLLDMAGEKFLTAMGAVNAGRAKMTALQNALAVPFSTAQGYFGEALRAIGSVSAFADKLVATPSGFLALFSSLSGGASGVASSFSGYGSTLQSMLGKSESAKQLSSDYAYAGDSTTSQVAVAAQRLVRDAVLVQIADEAAALPVNVAPVAPPATPALDQQIAQPVERPEVPVTADVLVMRDQLDAAFWAAALDDADHERFEQLEATRKALYRHLTAVAAAGVKLVEIKPTAPAPALVLAYRRFGDASRAGEIVTRNRIRHPGFVPPVTLQVAQE
ncbi:TPA: hypothetical protein L5C36_005619 [Pseudomonas aeruginosa]|nr:hypothetical protein [Pseudomonas aeruginosa]